MNKPDISKIIKNTKIVLAKRSPEILTGIGIAGMITTTILAVKATPKALELLHEKEKESIDKQVEEGVPYEDIKNGLTTAEVVKTAWKCYVPAAVTGVVSISCLIGANSVNARRTAALAAAYQISETALSEYRDKVVETIGEEKEKIVREKIANDKLESTPVTKSEVIIMGKGDTLFLDPLSKRYFKTDRDTVEKAENKLNKELLHDISGYVTLSEFYDEIGLDRTDISDDIGWNTDNLLDIGIYPGISDDGQPCLVLDYITPPKCGFDRF